MQDDEGGGQWASSWAYGAFWAHPSLWLVVVEGPRLPLGRHSYVLLEHIFRGPRTTLSIIHSISKYLLVPAICWALGRAL